MSKKEIWVAMAQHLHPEAPPHVIMREANILHETNEPQNWQKPFASVDVNFSELMELVRSTGTQRERDLVYVTNMFHTAWTTLHISMIVLKEKVSPTHEEQVRDVYAALVRLGTPHLLTEKLPKKWVKWLNTPTANKPREWDKCTLPIATVPGRSGEDLDEVIAAHKRGDFGYAEIPAGDM